MTSPGRRPAWERRLARFAAVVSGLLAVAVACGAVAERVTARRDARRFPPPGERIDVGGRRLHLRCVGEGRPTVVIEPGGTSSSAEYAPLQDALAATTRVCAYDRAGMGWSDPVDAPLDAGFLADDLRTLLDVAGVDPPWVLVAGSAGGLTAEVFARRHPDDVVGLVLLDALHSDLLAVDAMGAGSARLARKAWAARALASVGLLRVLDPYHLGRLPPAERRRAMALKYRAATWRAVTSLVGAGATSRARLAEAPPLRSDLPVVVITHDPARGGEVEIPEEAWRAGQEAFAARSTRGRVVVAEGSGHHPELDRADVVEAAILDLLDATPR